MTTPEIERLRLEIRDLRQRLLLLSDRVPREFLPLIRGESMDHADPFDSFGLWQESTALHPGHVEDVLAEAWRRTGASR